jgi:hypothetical protein
MWFVKHGSHALKSDPPPRAFAIFDRSAESDKESLNRSPGNIGSGWSRKDRFQCPMMPCANGMHSLLSRNMVSYSDTIIITQ